MTILLWIRQLKPKSVYDLARLLEKDPSNIAKLIQFFEEYGIIKLKSSRKEKRSLKCLLLNMRK